MKKTIIIAEDNYNCSKNIFNRLINMRDDIDVIGITNNGEETLKTVEKYNPYLLLLDLKMPKKNGIDVLEELEKNTNVSTKIIVISGTIPMINRLNLVNSRLVVKIFVKPFNWEELCLSIHNECCKKESNVNYISNYILIDEILHEFCFNFSSVFYIYLVKCINKAVEKQLSLKELYKEVSEEENVNYKNLKWGIEKLINSMNRYTPETVIKRYFSYTNKPSPKLFISKIVFIVKKE